MIPLRLPTEELPLYTKRYTLDRREWLFRFDWNARTGCWALDIGSFLVSSPSPSPNAEALWAVRGIRLTCDRDLLKPYRGRSDLPKYLLCCYPKGNDRTPPGLLDFGLEKRVELVYAIPDSEGS